MSKSDLFKTSMLVSVKIRLEEFQVLPNPANYQANVDFKKAHPKSKKSVFDRSLDDVNGIYKKSLWSNFVDVSPSPAQTYLMTWRAFAIRVSGC